MDATSEGCGAAGPVQLVDFLKELSDLESTWGPNHPCVAQCLRRLAAALAKEGRAVQAVPLWIRVVEIEEPVLGADHADVKAAKELIQDALMSPSVSIGAAAAYAAQTRRSSTSWQEVPEDIGQRPRAATEPIRGDCSDRSNAAAVAASVGGALIGGALHLGTSAMISTCCLAASATGHAASYVAQRAVAEALAPTPAVATVVDASSSSVAGSLASTAARAAVSATLSMAGNAAGATCGAVQQVGISLASSAATSALSFTGRHSWSTASWAMTGAASWMLGPDPVEGDAKGAPSAVEA